MSNPGDLVAEISSLATRLPAVQVLSLAAAVEALDGPTPAGRGVASSAVPTPTFKAAVTTLWDAWSQSPGWSGAAVALALRTAAGAAERLRAAQAMDVVWTGPSSVHVPVRMTDQVLIDLVANARSELIVVSFAAYKVPDVHTALRAAADRGVDIRLILETAKDSDGRLGHDAADAFKSLGASATFWVWPKDQRPAGGAAMHAKAAIADGRVALVTSANMTGAALAENMELGLLVTGGSVPRRLADHFRALMAGGVLTPVPGI